MPTGDGIPPIDNSRLTWNTTDLLGEGSFGIVYRGLYNGVPVAIKVLKRSPRNHANLSSHDNQQQIAALKQHRREINRFRAVQNPFIIQYCGVFKGQDPRDLYIVTEYLEGGSLHDSLVSMRTRSAILDTPSFLQVALHIAYGLNHVHYMGYTHGDMKPQNVLLTSAFEFTEQGCETKAYISKSAKAKIADFGLSKRLQSADDQQENFGMSITTTSEFSSGPCGTFLYMAPEIFSEFSTLTDEQAKSADVYSYGLILFELLSCLQSWQLEHVRNPLHLYQLVMAEKRPSWGSRKPFLDPRFICLVERCWSQDYYSRPTVDDIISTLTRFQEELKRCPSSSKMFKSPRNQEEIANDELHKCADLDSPNIESIPFQPDSSQTVLSQSEAQPILENRARSGKRNDELIDDNFSGVGATKPNESGLFISQEDEDSAIRWIESGLPLTQSEEISILHSIDAKRDKVIQASVTDSEDGSVTFIEDTETAPFDSLSNISVAIPVVSVNTNAGAEINFTASVGSGETLPERETEKESERSTVKNINSDLVVNQFSQHLDIPTNVSGQDGSMGTGSYDGSDNHSKRSNSSHLDSFYRAFNNPNSDGSNFSDPVVCSQPSVLASDSCSEKKFTESLHHNRAYTPEISTAASSDDEGVRSGEIPVPEDTKVIRDSEANRLVVTSYDSQGDTNIDDKLQHNNDQTNLQDHETTKDEAEQDSAVIHNRYAAPSVDLSEEDELAEFFGRVDLNNQMLIPSTLNTNSKNYHGKSNLNSDFGGQFEPAGGTQFASKTDSYSIGRIDVKSKNIARDVQTSKKRSNVSDNMDSGILTVSSTRNHLIEPRQSVGSGSNIVGRDTLHGRLAPVFSDSVKISKTSGTNAQLVFAMLEQAVSDREKLALELWNNGDQHAISNGLSKYSGAGGEAMLKVCCEMIIDINRTEFHTKKLGILRDLLTAVGNIARKNSQAITSDCVTMALNVMWISISMLYRHQVQQSNLFSACNYALCNLWKIQNIIVDVNLRNALAWWLVWTLLWNCQVNSNQNGQLWEVLGHTTTAAIRNFLWMNENNVSAFVSQKPGYSYSPTTLLISTVRFAEYANQTTLVISSLSALTMVIRYPIYRLDFVRREGMECIMQVLKRSATQPTISTLVYSMMKTLLSSPFTTEEDLAALSDIFVQKRFGQHLCTALNAAVQKSQEPEVLESGFSAVLAGCRLNPKIAQSFVEEDTFRLVKMAQQAVMAAVNGSFTTSYTKSESWNRLGVILAEITGELYKH